MNDDLIFLVQRVCDVRVDDKRAPVRSRLLMSSLDISDQHDAVIAAGRLDTSEQIDVLLDAVCQLSNDFDLDKSASIFELVKLLRRAVRTNIAEVNHV